MSRNSSTLNKSHRPTVRFEGENSAQRQGENNDEHMQLMSKPTAYKKLACKQIFGHTGKELADIYEVPEYLLYELLPVCDGIKTLEEILGVH